MPVPTSPSSLRHFTCKRASDLPAFVWNAMYGNEGNANVILPILLKCLKQEHAGIPVQDHLWIVVYTPISYDVKLILSCTDGLTGKYPVFLFTPIPYPSIQSDPDNTYACLEVAAVELCRALPFEFHRVYSVFGPEILCRTFVTLWSKRTGIQINRVPYYEAKVSYLTLETFVDAMSPLHQLVPGEMRPAERKDLAGVANLCFKFATEPFLLTPEGALAEARKLIKNGLVWVHTSGSGDDPERIVSIIAFTRNSDRVATITKVVTDPDCRGVGYGERLVRRVCAYLLHDMQKYAVALYVGRDNPAANVYGRVGFLGIGKGALPVEGVDPWVEYGFNQSYVELGHW